MRRRVASGHESSIRGPGFHRVNDLDLTVIPQQHDDFQKSACRVQPDPQFALRVLVIQGSACQRRPRGSDRVLVVDPAFVRGRGDDHARAHSRTAARIAAERSRPSRLARSIRSASSSSENCVGTTWDALPARGGRPQRFCSSSTS